MSGLTGTLVLDTSAAIYFDRLGYLGKLSKLVRLVLPEAVAAELRRKPGAAGSDVPDRPDVEVVKTEAPKQPQAGGRLALGEAAVIALAQKTRAIAVLDDRRAVRDANERGVESVDSITILVGIHRQRLAVRPIEEDISRLQEHGAWLSEAVANEAIRAVQRP